MDKKRIYLSCPTMHGEEQEFIREAFDTNWVAPLGPNVNAFEKEMEAYTGAGHASALSAGTAAIHLALRILGVGQGDYVFVPSLTFSATCNPIVYEKAVPVFIDSEEDTWNMDPAALRLAFEKYPNPKAVIVVHLYGTPAKLDEIMAICEEHQVPLVEDAAESLGSTYRGRHTGTFGKYGIYSFNGNKIITTSGGGMLVSGEEALVQEARVLSTQARDAARHYQHSKIGYNYRMSNIVAGIGRGQMKVLALRVEKKRKIFDYYREHLSGLTGVSFMPMHEDERSNCWLSVLLLSEESKVRPLHVMEALEQADIESRPVWKPMHLQPVFAGYDYVDNGGVAESLFLRGVCLPSDTKMNEEDLDRICQVIRGLWK